MMQCRMVNLFLLAILSAVLILLHPAGAAARDLVSGRYISSAGATIILDLEIKSPDAGNLIVHQYFPPDLEIVRSSPPVMKYDKGKAKWLIKRVQPGLLRIEVQMSGPVPPGQVRAEVRCRDKDSGQMIDIAIRP